MHDSPKHAYNEGRLEDARRRLLEEYSRKPVRRLIQIDGHRTEGDSAMHPDEEGHCLMAVEDYGLYNIAGTSELPVRVQIHEGADKQEVLSLLRKIADWVERDLYNMQLRVRQIQDQIQDPGESDLPF